LQQKLGEASRFQSKASGAYAKNGIVQQTVRLLKKELPSLLVITDVCLCEYMEHGHCGIVKHEGGQDALNDESLELLAANGGQRMPRAGADIVAPSDMMDGRVAGDSRGRWTGRFHETR
jgi:porphobilinogen synthase